MTRMIISRVCRALVAGVALLAVAACDDAVYDTLPPCPGAYLRFVYDYNMEYANAFPSQVDCLTLYVYDGDGTYVTTIVETDSVLGDENYRMQLDLPAGDYHFVAYGGLACDKASFTAVHEPVAGSTVADLQTTLLHNGATSNRSLHDFFYGSLDLTITTSSAVEGTVAMMKNTNNIQVILQQMSYQPVYGDDFTFAITDDNTLFGNDNVPISTGTTTYTPWTRGERTTGTRADDADDTADEDVVVAYAELSTSRLWTGNSPRLTICRSADGETVLSIPLNNYLLLMKSERYASMGNQEFLDRESNWTLIFFLDDDFRWISTVFVVNDWVVRINDSSFN